jgi:diguanylate cyclase (GGDEF)-like protein
VVLPGIRGAFLKILDSLRPVIKEECERQFCELQKKISGCESLLPLGRLGEQIGEMVEELINRAIDRMDYSDDFLIELSKDLSKMEQQLSSYQNYNRQTHQISSTFQNDMLSHAGEMHRAFDSGKSLPDIRHLISSKLNTISKTIEIKRQSDEARLREADAKIADLQNNLSIYKQEILQIRDRSESLEKEALLDELTQIHNRRSYELQIRENLRRYRHNGEVFSLILMDIDQFKRVNDEYGHTAGDKCLKEIAQLIKSSLRNSDFFARYGGEEMIAILYGSDARSARDVAEKIRNRIEKTCFSYRNEIIPITVSLGVTEVNPSDTEPEIPFIRADEAMYRAKRDGRNRVRVITDLPFCKIRGGDFVTGRVGLGAN